MENNMSKDFYLWPIPKKGEIGNNTDKITDSVMPKYQVHLDKNEGLNNKITFSKNLVAFDIKIESKYETDAPEENSPLRCIDTCIITPKNRVKIKRIGRKVKATQLLEKKWKVTNESNDTVQWKDYKPTEEQIQMNKLELQKWIHSNQAKMRGDMSRSNSIEHLDNGDIIAIDKPGSAFPFPKSYFPFLRSYDFWYIVEYSETEESLSKKVALGYSYDRNFQTAPW